MSKIKTSVSLRANTLRKLKKEAKRQRRSVSGVVELWIEDEVAKNGERGAETLPSREAVPA